jgi:Protein of unknown function (DUF4058)
MIEHNPYRGVNAHLNSFLQLEGWETFHTAFINEMSQFIDRILPSNYYAVSEKSLQITFETIEGLILNRSGRVVPDTGIFQTAVSTEPLISPQTAAPEMQMPLLVDEEETINATLIYHVEGGRFPGTPITRIELLSPSNKQGGSGYLTYLGKRSQTLRSGLRLVEIDFMHEQPPISRQLPSYPDRDPGAFPYMILVNDPRPTLREGQTAFYGSHVDDPLRIIRVPLADDDVIAVDFDAVYNQTFESYRVFRMLVDYNLEPARFQTYSPEDQQRIRAKMAEINQ